MATIFAQTFCSMSIAVVTGSLSTGIHWPGFFAKQENCSFHENIASVPANATAVIDCAFNNTPEHVSALRHFLPRPVFINSVIDTLAETDDRFIRFNGWPGLLNTTAVELAADEAQWPAAEAVCAGLQWTPNRVPDLAGFIAPRVIAMIVNEAWFAFEEGVSTQAEIDTAMQLGTNYPHGPFAWGRQIGLAQIYTLLKKLSATDARYTPAALLAAEVKNTQ